MTEGDRKFLEDIGLTWPPPDRITAGIPLPANLDSRIAARNEYRTPTADAG